MLKLIEQLPAPVHRRLQRRLALRTLAAASDQQPEPLIEELGQHVYIHVTDPTRRQLDGQRDAIETATDHCDLIEVRCFKHEIRSDRVGAIHEQLHRLGPVPVGTEGRNSEDVLPLQLERFPTRCEQGE